MGRSDDGATKRNVEPPSNTIPREQVAVNLAASWGVGFRRVLAASDPRAGRENVEGLRERADLSASNTDACEPA
jgi:hypothetical protein